MGAESLPKKPMLSCPDSVLLAMRAHLMRYARTPSPRLAGSIADCLDQLLADPRFKVPPRERCTFLQMRVYWRLVESLG